MTHENLKIKTTTAALIKTALLGAGIALIFISIFLIGINNPNPEWSEYWMARPLIIVPLAGAMGGIFFHFMRHFQTHGSLIKTMAIIFGIIGYIVIVWLGFVLGLDGTLWD